MLSSQGQTLSAAAAPLPAPGASQGLARTEGTMDAESSTSQGLEECPLPMMREAAGGSSPLSLSRA